MASQFTSVCEVYMQSDDMCMGVICNEWQYGMSFSAPLVDVFLSPIKVEELLSDITVKQ